MRLTQYSFPTAVGLAGTLMFVAGCGQEPAEPTQATPGAARTAEATAGADRYLVLFKQGKAGATVAATALSADMARLGGKVERSHADIGVMQVRMTASAAAELRKRPDIEAVAQDRRMNWLPPGEEIGGNLQKFTGQSNQRTAAFFDFQWNIKRIKAPQAWDASNQGKGTMICILDTGVDPRQIDLKGKLNLESSVSFVSTERADRDFDLHGTAMASIATSNGIGIASVAPDAGLCSVKVLDKTGSGTFGDVTAGIMYVGDVGQVDGGRRVTVANMSLGALLPANDPDVQALVTIMQRAVDYSTRRGVLFVASAGNEATNLNNSNVIHLPSSLNNVLSVGATGPIGQTRFDHVASYSNTGQRGTDVFAPGGEFAFADNVLADLILAACSPSNKVAGFESCSTNDGYLFLAGTSPAAAHVSGEAAVIEAQLPGNQSPAELTACILHSADPLPNPSRTAAGRINVLRGLSCPS
jgi:subtilisin family serine protease